MARDSREGKESLDNLFLTVNDWKNVYRVKNLTVSPSLAQSSLLQMVQDMLTESIKLSKPEFTASFEAGSFTKTGSR